MVENSAETLMGWSLVRVDPTLTSQFLTKLKTPLLILPILKRFKLNTGPSTNEINLSPGVDIFFFVADYMVD